MKEILIPNSDLGREKAFGQLWKFSKEQDKAIVLKVTDKRSLSANAQVHVWCKVISKKTGEDVKTIFNRVKRDFGLPILLSDPVHGPVANFILDSTNYHKRRDDKQLMIIDAMEVTRKLSTKQHNELRDNMQAFWRAQGLELVYLEEPK